VHFGLVRYFLFYLCNAGFFRHGYTGITPMTYQNFDAVQAEWALQIGWFSIRMGEVESALATLLKLADQGTSGDLKELISRLLKNVEVLQTARKDELRDLLAEAEVVRGLRNTVLHSGLFLQPYFEGIPEDQIVNAADVADTPILVRSKIWDRKGINDKIDMAEMLLLVERVQRISRDIWAIAYSEQMIKHGLG